MQSFFLKLAGNTISSMALRKCLLKDGLLNWAVGKLYNKKFLLKNNIKFDSNKNVGEDFDFVVKVLNSNPKIQYLNRITYMYLYNDKTGIARDIVDPKKSVENAKSIEELRFNILSTIFNTSPVFHFFSRLL